MSPLLLHLTTKTMNIITPQAPLSTLVKAKWKEHENLFRRSTKKPRRSSLCCSTVSDSTEVTALTEQSDFSDFGLTVRFAPTAYLCPTLSLRDYTQEEIEACWYQSEEYTAIRKDCIKQIRNMENGVVQSQIKKVQLSTLAQVLGEGKILID